jgi:hypothetical protein
MKSPGMPLLAPYSAALWGSSLPAVLLVWLSLAVQFAAGKLVGSSVW